MDIIILGAGGIGSLVGALLSRNNDVLLIGRKAHVDEINKNGLKISGSISKNLKAIDTKGKNSIIQTLGRHDCCLAPRIIPVAEAMTALVLVDKWMIGPQRA